MSDSEALTRVDIVDYDPRWALWFDQERALFAQTLRRPFNAHEHIGSTSVAGQRAKPIIDMMASYEELPSEAEFGDTIHPLGYVFIPTGMKNRLLYRKDASADAPMFYLHVVGHDTWESRKERIMRDYLRQHPEAVQSYGLLKDRLARDHADDSLAYTQGKTAFIQGLMDAACDERGIARFDVWND